MTTHWLSRALPALAFASALTACGDADHPPPVAQGGEASPPTTPIISPGDGSSNSGASTGATSGTGDDGPSFSGTTGDSGTSFGGTNAGGSASFGGSVSIGGSSSIGGTVTFGGSDSNFAGTFASGGL